MSEWLAKSPPPFLLAFLRSFRFGKSACLSARNVKESGLWKCCSWVFASAFLGWRSHAPLLARPCGPRKELRKFNREQVQGRRSPARFFIQRDQRPTTAQTRVPLEALLLQIENHVRLEQAAAESFLSAPTSALLHGRTISPFVN